MSKIYYRDEKVIITKGTLTVGDSTYPLTGILSFRVSQTGYNKIDWQKTLRTFKQWFMGLAIVALGVVAYASMTIGFSWIGLIVFLGLSVGGAGFVAWWKRHHFFVVDRYWLWIQTTSGDRNVISARQERYIRTIASKLGEAMADR